MSGNSYLTINREAVNKNVTFLKRKLGGKVRISAVVKANAYGHGIEQMVPLFEKEGIDHFAVFDFEEAKKVKNIIRSDSDIMIMGWIADNDIEDSVLNGFEIFIYNTHRLIKTIEKARKLKKKVKIHLEIETGMNRLGLDSESFIKAISIIDQNRDVLEIKGFCTHLAGAESVSNYKRIISQLKKYKSLLNILEKNMIYPEYKHVANSAAAIVYPKSKMDMVRVGIMLYGLWSSPETFIHYTHDKKVKSDPLHRILGWKSSIMSIKDIKEGEFIGYGISYLTQKETRIAIIPVGYAMGYNRSLSNKGRVLINGYRCGVIGIVNMNMIIVDITNVPNANIGDEVVLIGKQGDLEIKVSSFSNISNELNYEVLAHMPENLERKII